jgi:hypothetical protein
LNTLKPRKLWIYHALTAESIPFFIDKLKNLHCILHPKKSILEFISGRCIDSSVADDIHPRETIWKLIFPANGMIFSALLVTYLLIKCRKSRKTLNSLKKQHKPNLYEHFNWPIWIIIIQYVWLSSNMGDWYRPEQKSKRS